MKVTSTSAKVIRYKWTGNVAGMCRATERLWLVSWLVDCGHDQIVGAVVTPFHTRGHTESRSTLLMNIISDRGLLKEGGNLIK